MLKALFIALNVHPNEEKQVLLLLGKGFFMGVFLATYEVSAETLFLNRLSEYLKEAILLSGFLGIVTTTVFAYAQSKLNFGKLALGNLLVIFLFIAGVFFLFKNVGPNFQDYLIFTMFAMTGPILAVVLLGFWGTFGRMFDLRQSKRIIGGIDIGQLLASIIALFTIPFLEQFIPDTTNYLLICAASLLIALIFMWLIQHNYSLAAAESSNFTEADDNLDTRIKSLAKNNYVRLLSAFLLFSMVTFTFVQYSFQEVVARQYPEETELRNFIALFRGSILVLGLILQTFVNDRIISEYGLKTALLILPVILAVFTFGAIFTGEVFGYSIADGSSFIFFFLFVSLSRLFNFSLRDSLENPTFKLYFMPLDNRIRFDIQTKVEGVVNETSRFIAGGLIILLSFLSFFELVHYSYALVLVLVGYFLIVDKLYDEYRNRIRLKLEKQQRAILNTVMAPSQKLIETLNGILSDKQANRVVFSFKLLEKVQPSLLPQSINKMMGHDSPEIRDFAQFKMNELKGLSVSDRYVISMNKADGEDRKNIVNNSDILEMFSSGDISKTRLYRLCKSSNDEDRQYAAELLSNATGDENISFLIELLNDNSAKVRKTAIKTAQRKYNDDVINALIYNLSDAAFSLEAANALTLIGEKALPVLESAFYKSGQHTQTRLKIVAVMGRIGGKKAIDHVWGKIDYPDKVIVSQVLLSLADSGFKAGVSQISRIKYAVETDIENISWNMAALGEVSEEHFGDQIKRALREEIDYDIEHIYMLLSMLYDAHSIQLVKENIESKTSEGVTYAIELLDVFLSEDLKQKVIPVVDDLTYSEKAKKLELFYPRGELDADLVLKFILNRDFSQTNRYTKACVIYQIGLLRIDQFKLDLIAHIFNPDWLIKEMAAWALYQLGENIYNENIKRLPFHEKKRLDEVVLKESNIYNKSRAFEKILFLKDMDAFSEVSGLALAGVVDIVEVVVLEGGGYIAVDDHYNDNFYIVFDGLINIYESGRIIGGTQRGEFIGELLPSKSSKQSNKIMAVENSVLFKIQKDTFYELLSDNVSLAQKIVKLV